MKWNYTPEYRPTLVLVFLLIVSLGLIVFNFTNRIQALRYFVYYVLNPTPELALKIFDDTKYLADNLLSIVRLKEDNRYLQEQVNKLAYLNEKCADLTSENKRLREILNLKKSADSALISASVISRDPSDWFRSVTINKGKDDGIEPDLPVIAFMDSKEVLVGKTISVTQTASKILLITERLSSIPAKALNSSDYGLVEGNNSRDLFFNFLLQDSTVKIGDDVTTSGIGEVFPSGLFIGTVIEVHSEKEKYFKQAIVKPALKLNRIREVFIIKKT